MGMYVGVKTYENNLKLKIKLFLYFFVKFICDLSETIYMGFES